MRSKTINMTLADADPDGVFADQTLGGAGAFTLDGAQVVNGVWTSPDGLARIIGFESAGDLSGVTLTVTGYLDRHRNIPISETLSGPNAATVETVNHYAFITSITADGAVGTDLEAGPVNKALSPIIPLDRHAGSVALGTTVTGTLNYTVQQTFDNLEKVGNAPWDWGDSDDANMVGAATSRTSQYDAVPRAIRIGINSYISGASLKLGVSQQFV